MAVSNNPSENDDPVFLWVNYRPEEVNDGYWAVYRELALPASLVTIFCFSFAVGVGSIMANLANFEPVNGLLLMLLAAFVFPPLLCLYAYMILRGRLMKSYENRPNFHFPMMYTLSPLGCQVEYASGAGLLDWQNFTLALESPASFCLASNVEDVFVLPKRCLGSEAEVEKVRAMLKGNVRLFRRARGRNIDVAFEKAKIEMIIHEGIDQVVKAAEKNEAVESTQIEEPTEIESEKNPVDQSPLQFTSPLKSGLAVEILYQPGEIVQAEKIYFFRKRLIMLASSYIAYTVSVPVFFVSIGSLWGMFDYCQRTLEEIAPLVIFIIPIFFVHALCIYLMVFRRSKLSEHYASPFVFQFTEEGCGVRFGERYAVLAWWHFKECWETEDQFLILVGQRGNAMYVIPKRVFPDKSGLNYLADLLKRKVGRYKNLVG